jgi:hypothetical protein
MAFVEKQIENITGQTAAEASIESANIQAEAGQQAIEQQRLAGQEAQAFFDPFSGIAQQGIDQAGFLADPQAQFEFLQSNPLFKLALENANTQTEKRAAASGRLSAGDTLQDLSNNVLLASSPLIDRQRQDIGNLLNIGTGIAGSRANTALGVGSNVGNLLTDISSAQAAGQVGAANAASQGTQNLIDLGIRGADALNIGGGA